MTKLLTLTNLLSYLDYGSKLSQTYVREKFFTLVKFLALAKFLKLSPLPYLRKVPKLGEVLDLDLVPELEIFFWENCLKYNDQIPNLSTTPNYRLRT